MSDVGREFTGRSDLFNPIYDLYNVLPPDGSLTWYKGEIIDLNPFIGFPDLIKLGNFEFRLRAPEFHPGNW